MPKVPLIRIRSCNDRPVNPAGEYALYWMIAYRRVGWNFALQRAVEWAQELAKPLVILEALRADYPWASDRFHSFILDGMRDNEQALADKGCLYYPYLAPQRLAGKGLLSALASRACVVVTDDFPCFFLPRMIAAASAKLTVKLERVDSNGLLPLAAADRTFTTAHSFRRFLQKNLPAWLLDAPEPDPLRAARLPRLDRLPEPIQDKWPRTSVPAAGENSRLLKTLPIDHSVAAVSERGGQFAASARLREFADTRLVTYSESRNHPDDQSTSGLSPYLHFGHISAHQIFHEIALAEDWSPDRLATRASGSREGWWGVSPHAEAFLDQLVTWRELGFNMCDRVEDYDQYESLPEWARNTLEAHSLDPRDPVYSEGRLTDGATYDGLWNAAQTELVRHGRIHNYLRMLWGKKILQWTRRPRQALDIMIELNNRYALDGRDPNSYSGIFWILGRYDRAWGPERPIFGKIRYMSSENTARKVRLKRYLNNLTSG